MNSYFSLNKKFDVFLRKLGSNGIIGRGGIGAKTTKDGATIVIERHRGLRSTTPGATYSSTNGSDGTINDLQIKQANKLNKLSYVVNRYKNYCREQMSDTNKIRQTYITQFLNRLTNNKKITELYDTFGYVNEFDALERQYLQLENKLQFEPFLNNLLDRIVEYSEEVKDKPVEKKVLSFLYTTTLSKLYMGRNKISNNTVYDLNGTLTRIKEDIDNLKNIQSREIIKNYQNEYKTSLEVKKNEAKKIIDMDVKTEIDNIFNTIDNHIDRLLVEIVEDHKSTQQDILKNKEMKRELEEKMILRLMLAPLKIAAPIVSLFGPQGAIVGTLLTAGSSVTENLILDNSSAAGNDKIPIMPKTFSESFKRLTDQINNRYEIFKTQIVEIDKAIMEYEKENTGTAISSKDDIKKIQNKITECKALVAKMDADQYGRYWESTIDDKRKELNNLFVEFKTAQEQRKNSLQSEDAIKKNNANRKIKLVNNALAVANAVEAGVDVYNRYKNDDAKIQQINEIINKQKQRIKNLNDRKTEIQTIGIPYIRSVKDDLDRFQATNSTPEMMVKKWKLQNYFRQMQSEFSKMTREFSVDKDIRSCLTSIDEGMATMIDIYDRINSYAETEQMVNYIANVNSAHAVAININDENLRNDVERLQKIIKSNLVIAKWKLAIHATKQHYFPMIVTFLQQYKLPVTLQTDDTDSVREHAIQQINNLINDIADKKSMSAEYDDDLYSSAVFNGTEINPAFYRWPYEQFKSEIYQLLLGSPVKIKADIINGVDFNAVKFNEIRIHFKLHNKVLQNEFDNDFGNLTIHMTRFGTNYYRCHNRIYGISIDRDINMEFRYANMQWINPNETFEKIKKNTPFLSPYGLWQIQISGNIGVLSKYQNETMDMELLGRGSFLKHGAYTASTGNNQLDDYYPFYKIISA